MSFRCFFKGGGGNKKLDVVASCCELARDGEIFLYSLQRDTPRKRVQTKQSIAVENR